MKEFIKKIYGSIANNKPKTCGDPKALCCSKNTNLSESVGYSKEELDSIPKDADMGLGCGNPVALASLKEGETVVDLGSGGGIDVFLASKRVGESGKAIGIDMTQEMLDKARENAKKGGFSNVEFKLGEIEKIPLEDSMADCIISNCVINLAENKQNVFNESFRVLKPGGRLMVSDMVLLSDLPEEMLASAHLYVGCVAGALKKDDYLSKIKTAGFSDIKIIKEDAVELLKYVGSDKVLADIIESMSPDEIAKINNTVVSLKVFAKKYE